MKEKTMKQKIYHMCANYFWIMEANLRDIGNEMWEKKLVEHKDYNHYKEAKAMAFELYSKAYEAMLEEDFGDEEW